MLHKFIFGGERKKKGEEEEGQLKKTEGETVYVQEKKYCIHTVCLS